MTVKPCHGSVNPDQAERECAECWRAPCHAGLGSGDVLRFVVWDFWENATYGWEPAGTFADSRHFAANALPSCQHAPPCIMLDYSVACIFRPHIGIGVLGVASVGGVDPSGRPPLLQGIAALRRALQVELAFALANEPAVFARHGTPACVPAVATADEIFRLLLDAPRTGGGYRHPFESKGGSR